jgi:hypothetical protein
MHRVSAKEHTMTKKLHTIGALAAILGLGLGTGWSTAARAAVQTTGSEMFDGIITVSGASGKRVVLATEIRLRGVFNGMGKIVEQPPQPGDPDNLDRDDLVFPQSTLHITSTDGAIVSFKLNPHSCTASGTMQKPATVVGGTGLFAGATGSFPTGTVSIRALAARNPDGSCNLDQVPLHEVDTVAGSGSLSF